MSLDNILWPRVVVVVEPRSEGAEIFEVSPLGPGKLLAGKFLTYFGLVLVANLTIAAVLNRKYDPEHNM